MVCEHIVIHNNHDISGYMTRLSAKNACITHTKGTKCLVLLKYQKAVD